MQKWLEFAQYSTDTTLQIFHKSDRCQSVHQQDLLIIFRFSRCHDKERGGSLRMADVVQLFESGISGQDVIDHGGQVQQSNFVPREIEELSALWAIAIRIHELMFT